LLEGDTEKQVAARLGLSHATVHQYITMLYRRFGVQSRAALMSHVLKRRDWRAVLHSAGSSRIDAPVASRTAASAHS
jgi:predicted transcriptional regulator